MASMMNHVNNKTDVNFIWKGISHLGYFELKISAASVDEARFKLLLKIKEESRKLQELEEQLERMLMYQETEPTEMRGGFNVLLKEMIEDWKKKNPLFYENASKIKSYNILDSIMIGTTYGRGFILLREFIQNVEPHVSLL